jgi:fumarate hydratase class I
VSVDVAAKGGGSENKSKFKMMNPSDNIVDWVLEMLPQMGAGWCPPGMLGIGIGGTAEHCVLLAKQSLMEPIDMAQLKARGPQTDIEALRIEIFDKVNALGIGAQGLGGLSTILDVKIIRLALPCRGQAGGDDPQLRRHPPRAFHARRLGSRPISNAEARRVARCPLGARQGGESVDLDTLTPEVVQSWKAGRPPAAQRQDADRARRRAQAYPGHAGEG